jgi:hypothetical protein
MIADAAWYAPNTVIRTDLQTPAVKEGMLVKRKPKRPSTEPHGATRQQAIPKTLPNDLPTTFLVSLSYL